MSTPQMINEETFFEQYKPKQNHLVSDAGLDGCSFAIHGYELDYVRTLELKTIWTYQQNDEGQMCIVNGIHWVNAEGFLVTEIPWTTDVYVSMEELTLKNQTLEPGIYWFDATEYDSVEEALAEGSAVKFPQPIKTRSIDSLCEALDAAMSIIDAIGNEDWIAVFASPAYELQAIEIRTLDDNEKRDLLNHLAACFPPSKATFVEDVSVLDPDTLADIDVSIFKDSETGGMIGIDYSFLKQLGVLEPVINPFTGKEILLPE